MCCAGGNLAVCNAVAMWHHLLLRLLSLLLSMGWAVLPHLRCCCCCCWLLLPHPRLPASRVIHLSQQRRLHVCPSTAHTAPAWHHIAPSCRRSHTRTPLQERRLHIPRHTHVPGGVAQPGCRPGGDEILPARALLVPAAVSCCLWCCINRSSALPMHGGCTCEQPLLLVPQLVLRCCAAACLAFLTLVPDSAADGGGSVLRSARSAGCSSRCCATACLTVGT